MALSKPNIRQPEPGDIVCLYVGSFDPPTMDLRRAVDALFARPELAGVWVCPSPCASHERVQNMGTMFCAEYAAQTGRMLTFCNVAMSKGLCPADMASWARRQYPYLRFRLGGQWGYVPIESEPVYAVRFFGQPDVPANTISVSLDQYHSISDGIRERIAVGNDESKNMSACTWDYIQKHKLYR